MSQAYSDPKRESDPHALPDLEVWQADIMRCPVCEDEYPDTGDREVGHRATGDSCCNGKTYVRAESGWWYWYCFPGCLPDSDPIGPFASEDEALTDAREWLQEQEE
jgi:hypothetical protein